MEGRNVIQLDEALYQKLVEHAYEELPHEACGIVAGRGGQAVKMLRLRNADKSPDSYRFDAREQLRIFTALTRDDLDLFGIYHSHPDAEAYPSPRDLRLAFYPECRYLILSLADGQHPILRSFLIEDGRVVSEDLLQVRRKERWNAAGPHLRHPANP